MGKQYWVIGGEFEDTSFTQLSNGGAKIFGPFHCYETARRQWDEISIAHRPQATVRFQITETSRR
ncbi:MAG: hypothetical protein EAZ99_12295 [Alphaproteobacteria bacterium]|nr:hypothetical protein [Alphaproteobacteria bacterium]TAD88803.1 MAG: hypothetical protein EAZ99_12295 [Alphaproteobacteria bacterium]